MVGWVARKDYIGPQVLRPCSPCASISCKPEYSALVKLVSCALQGIEMDCSDHQFPSGLPSPLAGRTMPGVAVPGVAARCDAQVHDHLKSLGSMCVGSGYVCGCWLPAVITLRPGFWARWQEELLVEVCWRRSNAFRTWMAGRVDTQQATSSTQGSGNACAGWVARFRVPSRLFPPLRGQAIGPSTAGQVQAGVASGAWAAEKINTHQVLVWKCWATGVACFRTDQCSNRQCLPREIAV